MIRQLCLLATFLGGVVFRVASSSLPIDPTARIRRYMYAAIAFVTLPLLSLFGTGMQGQEFHFTVGAALFGLVIALGILVSGDRRANIAGNQ